jgi:transposase-like protein
VPRVREEGFLLCYNSYVITLYAVGVNTRKISQFLESIYGAYYLPQSVSRLIKVTEDEEKSWKERALSEG